MKRLRRIAYTGWVGRLAIAGFGAFGGLALAGSPAAASISSNCHAVGFASSSADAARAAISGVKDKASAQSQARAASGSSSIVIDSASEWTVDKSAQLSGFGWSDVPMKNAAVYAGAFGVGAFQVAGGQDNDPKSDGNDHGSGGPVDASQYSDKTPALYFTGGASGNHGSCSGSLTVRFSNDSAASTVAGKAAIGTAVVGAAGLALTALRKVG